MSFEIITTNAALELSEEELDVITGGTNTSYKGVSNKSKASSVVNIYEKFGSVTNLNIVVK